MARGSQNQQRDLKETLGPVSRTWEAKNDLQDLSVGPGRPSDLRIWEAKSDSRTCL